MRPFLCAIVALGVLAGGLFAQDEAKKKKKAAAGTSGEIVKFDGAAGTITVKVTLKKKSTEEKVYTVTDKTAVVVAEGKTKTDLKVTTVKELFQDAHFKEGAQVSFETDEDGKTLKTLTFGSAKKKKKDK